MGPGRQPRSLPRAGPGKKEATVDTGEAEKHLPHPIQVGPGLANGVW